MGAAKHKTLESFISAELGGPAQPEAKAFAKSLSEDFNGAVEAVLYYGSCLRTGEVEGLILDFYVIVSDYKSAHGHFFSGLGNSLVPPNVYYREIQVGKKTIRAKVAVVSLEDFKARVTPKGLNVSIWARFAQPARLLFAKNKAVEKDIHAAVCQAVITFAGETVPLVFSPEASRDIWIEGLKRTYGAELRSEDAGKAEELYLLNKNYFDAITPLLLSHIEITHLPAPKKLLRRWVYRRFNGKAVSVLRLIKAMFTFQGGIDYLAWKIQRSSGVEVNIKPWHRKVPLIAGVVLFIQLRLKGAFR